MPTKWPFIDKSIFDYFVEKFYEFGGNATPSKPVVLKFSLAINDRFTFAKLLSKILKK